MMQIALVENPNTGETSLLNPLSRDESVMTHLLLSGPFEDMLNMMTFKKN
ncbi:tRNA U34 5-carboxymethylaminomethyl modifying GTPase MnmE/TrmE [Caldalkalibacillus uzonensis]|uniref:tRNA U34 5-carboxymethylaminomethyl modifying GTPase MnmE/TrmE n=1 Tax=Caldalkalibacillus uzonensis TaxID=353224 RepID=A0ABU0CQP1_9BACI|nr:hypothetical protein [Caldalkalibacillus uzonensis]MDQ0338457.1 tRNA U34 5-carboxymethylaminomethyl modifying GTPase MnmE/TrmE [Caldalkalibacillus uzonensis]